MKKTAAWREYAEEKDLAKLERLRARVDRMEAKVAPVRSEYRAEFERVKNYSVQRMRRSKPSSSQEAK